METQTISLIMEVGALAVLGIGTADTRPVKQDLQSTANITTCVIMSKPLTLIRSHCPSMYRIKRVK